MLPACTRIFSLGFYPFVFLVRNEKVVSVDMHIKIYTYLGVKTL